MKRTVFFFLMWLACSLAARQVSAQKAPNILCLVAEDISPYLGAYGDTTAKSPFLDRLAKEGIVYKRMYTPVGVCAPSRAALITGMYPTSIGANYMRNTTKDPTQRPPDIEPYEVVLPTGVTCYTEYLRAAGYYCTNNSKTDYQFAAPLTAWDETGKEAHWKKGPKDKPFFAIFNLDVTHESFIWGRNKEPLVVDPKTVPLPPYFPDDSVVRHDVAVMYSNIFEMDRQAARLVNELKEAGALHNTIILFYSDNGGPLPRQKREVYESGTLVPFMIRFPDGERSGEVTKQLVSFVDIPATILSLAGIKPPGYMHGQAFLGPYAQAPRDYVFGRRDRMDEQVDKQGYVRSSQFRYVKNYFPEKPGYMPVTYRLQMPMMQRMLELHRQGKLNAVQERWFAAPRPAEELYDVEADPHELNNLSGDAAYKSELQKLRQVFDDWNKTYNPFWESTETENRRRMWPAGTQPVASTPLIKRGREGVLITSPTPGASIAYQVNGKGYTKDHWLLYSRPLAARKGDVISAIAVRAGFADSKPVSYTVR